MASMRMGEWPERESVQGRANHLTLATKGPSGNYWGPILVPTSGPSDGEQWLVALIKNRGPYT